MPRRTARQVQLGGALRGRRHLAAGIRGVCLRYLGAFGLPRRAAWLLQRHQPVPACRGPRVPSRTGCASARCRAAGRWPRRCRPPGAGTSTCVPTTTSWSTIRWNWGASGAANSRCVAWRTSSWSPAPGRPSTASACWPMRAASATSRSPSGTAAARRRCTRYVFLLNAVDEGYGGLEHRCSTALISARRHLPRQGVAEASDGYVTLLGLISHEYFHTWNVKRLKPREFERIDFGRENYTRLLWFFEGFTSYYDDLLLLRAGLIDAPRYLRLLGQHAQRRVGHARAQAAKRGRGQLRRLGEVLPQRREHAQRHDQLLHQGQPGGAGAGPEPACRRPRQPRRGDAAAVGSARPGARSTRAASRRRCSRSAAGRWTRNWRPGCTAPTSCRCSRCWRRPGCSVQPEPGDLAAELGLRVSEGALSGIHVKTVHRGSAAERAGVCAGDELLAVDGWRLRRLDDARGWLAAGQGFRADAGARPAPAGAAGRARHAARRAPCS